MCKSIVEVLDFFCQSNDRNLIYFLKATISIALSCVIYNRKCEDEIIDISISRNLCPFGEQIRMVLVITQ